MGKLILITGGARSGKSTYGEKLAKEMGKNITYIATAIPFDDGMKDRIKKHRASRPPWPTIEKYKEFEKLAEHPDFISADLVLLDCMTVLITNEMMDTGLDFDQVPFDQIDEMEKDIQKQIKYILDSRGDKNLIMVGNELGMGLVPPYRIGRIFRDIAGRVNQLVAAQADEVYFCVSGIPMKIK